MRWIITGTLLLLLGGCTAVAVVDTAATVTTTAVKTTAKGVAAAGRLTYRGARAAGRAIAGSEEPDASDAPDSAASGEDKPVSLDPPAR